jgi:hypothetical protein
VNRKLVEVRVLATNVSHKQGRNRCELRVDGPSVFVRFANTERELPRAACELVYTVTEAAPAKAKKAKGS